MKILRWGLAYLGAAAVDRILARGDRKAVARAGLEVTQGPRGRRTYRDPRWDTMKPCPGCGRVYCVCPRKDWIAPTGDELAAPRSSR